METLKIVPYSDDWAERWDRFVMGESSNGTFLQTRRFLSYHPTERFKDVSLMMMRENQELMCVLPAAECRIDGRLVLRSHPGSTFGGPVISHALNHAQPLIDTMAQLDGLIATRYDECDFKLTPELLATHETETLQYALFYLDYRQDTEIVTYLPLQGHTHEELRTAYSYNKRSDLKKCEKEGLTWRVMTTDEDIAAFHALLAQNLQKFDAKPVHTASELQDFQHDRLKNEITFLGIHDTNRVLVAGACLFAFEQANVLHTQYLATDLSIRRYAPASFLYDSVIHYALEQGFKAVSFGTSTFERGHVLNTGLVQNKECFGTVHTLNRLFSKRFT